ncbi:MAG: HlyD family type I secretion periplasmic adaptor subunit [Pseudomonadota bacterium]
MSQVTLDKRPSITSAARRFTFPTETTFLSQAVLLEEAGPPRVPALSCLFGFVLVAIALAAGMLIQIDVVTSSQGQIRAAGGNQVLQSFDGGFVAQIHAEEGQIVQAGDILVTLDDPEAQAEFDRLSVRQAGLVARALRLQSLTGMTAQLAIEPNDDDTPIANEQMSILPIEQQALIAERTLVQAEIDTRLKAVQNLQLLEEEATRRVTFFDDELARLSPLFAKGLLIKSRLLEAERDAIDAQERLKEIQGQIREAKSGLLESRRRLDNVVAGGKLRHGDQLSSLLLDLNETRQRAKTMRQRMARGTITAPSAGIVFELKAKNPGQTIAPGDPIVEIIPIDGGLEAEVRLPPSEISHIHPGQPVRITIDGIEPHRHGYLEATVGALSPSTFVDENALPYYRASLALSSEELDGIALTPGMTIQAQIKTGYRTILEYLLKPVYRAWSTAFHER